MNFYKKNLLNDPHFGNEIKTKRGSSETLRNETCLDFHWLAGLIDADGGFSVSRGHFVSCEITMHEKEAQTLYFLKKHLGGSVKPRLKKQAVRWRLHKRDPLLTLLQNLNGLFQTERLTLQFQKALDVYGIQPLPRKQISLTNAWLSGFFCGDGSFSINKTAGYQPSVSISQKEKPVLTEIALLFGGEVYYDTSWDGWIWWIDARTHVEILNYFQRFRLHNPLKQARLKSIRRLVGYLDRKVHLDPNSKKRLEHFVHVFQANEIKKKPTSLRESP